MKRLSARIVLSASTALSLPKSIFASNSSYPPVGAPPIAGGMMTPVNIFDRLLHLVFWPIGLIALIFYGIYFLLKVWKKKKKKTFLYIGNIAAAICILIVLAWLYFDLIGETSHFEVLGF